jgi:hypothetical protein
MLRLRLGVIEISYSFDTKTQKKRVGMVRGKLRINIKKAQKPEGEPENKTTGDVATILEAKYHVMENFAHRYNDAVIVPAAEQALKGQLENMLLGAPTNSVSYDEANSTIEHAFRHFIDNKEMDGMPGVPTMAAQKGINHRLKHPYRKSNPERPSFLDTGLYQATMVAEISDPRTDQ